MTGAEMMEKEIQGHYDKLEDFLSGAYGMMHEYQFDDPEFKWRVIRLCRLATDLKLSLDELDAWSDI